MEDNEFSTPFSTNFFTDFSSEFSGFIPSNIELPSVTEDVSIPDIKPSEPEAKEPSFEDEYNEFINWNKKYKNKEERIIKQHKAKYKEFIDEYEEERKNSTIEYIPSSISNYPRVDTAFDLLYRGIDRNTEEIAKSIGCVIRGQTLYPIDWSREEVEELNRRLKR